MAPALHSFGDMDETMRGQRVRDFLEQQGVAYEEKQHIAAIAAQRVAAAEHESGWRVAKPVMLKVGGQLAMALIPAPARVDLAKVKAGLGTDDVSLASEQEFAHVFDDCEVGAEPIFGNIYGVPVYFDRCLRQDPYLVFRDGTHARTLKIATEDFLRLVEPMELDLGSLPH